MLVGVDLPGAALDFDASISELAELAKGAGLSISGPPLRRRLRQPDPQTYTDSNGVDRIREAIADLVEEGAEEVAVVFDDELTPDQQKNLEKRLQVPRGTSSNLGRKKIDKGSGKQARFRVVPESPYLSRRRLGRRSIRRIGSCGGGVSCCGCPSVGSAEASYY